MGVSIEQHRAAIGNFDGRPKMVNFIGHRRLSDKFKTFWLMYMMCLAMNVEVDPWVILLLVLCMDVETNPGPLGAFTDSKVKICNINIRSINAKSKHTSISRFEAFQNALCGNYDILTTTETWLKDDHKDINYALDGYKGPYRLDRPDNTGHGGVAAWVSDSLISKRRLDLEILDHETMWISIANKETKALIGISYRQKLGDYAPNYWENLQASYDKAIATKIPNIVLVGDFNAHPGSEMQAYKILLEFISINNLTQHIKEPTRVTKESEAILDLIMTNLPMLATDVGVGGVLHENDHRTIYGTINMKSIRRQIFTRDMWDFKNANFDLFREELSNADWDSCLESEDIDTICNKWTALFTEISEKCIGKKRVKVRPEEKNWYNNYLRRLRRTKDREYGVWAKTRTLLHWEIYKIARNKYFQECDRIKLDYEEHIYATLANEINKNPKKWWSLVGQTMGSSKK